VAQPIRVVLVEDNDVFRQTLEYLLALQPDIEVIATIASGDKAPEVCARLAPDVVLMDYRMPGLDGAQATEAVLEAAPAARVVCLTASLSRDETSALIAAGAVASLTKDADLEEIVAAIREAAVRAPRA
jgi:DNA-binding NarL/FixJ family response regulator